MTVNLSNLSANSSLALNNTFLSAPPLIFKNGLVEVCPVICLSSFSLVSIHFAVSTACLRSSMGNSTQYNFVGSVFLNTSKFVALHTLEVLLPALLAKIRIYGLHIFIKIKTSPHMKQILNISA